MNVLSLCNGSQSRFEGNTPKQLALINGEPLLVRTARMVRERGFEMRVFTHNKLIEEVCAEHRMDFVHLVPTDKLVETVIKTRPFWEERVVFLLGDVYFTDAALNTIFNDSSDIKFFGTHYELFALVFAPTMYDFVYKNSVDANINTRGKMWHLFRGSMNVPPEEHLINKFSKHKMYHRINDVSCDIDTVKEYEKLLENTKKEESG